ncbi:hypothetical protein [Dyadobacter sp. CY343]|uniref:hypothetical protein n=1 Tax=Dyadobacter sp. CY343 TaxID=2907299 RepID=UPI001F1AE261|nr:hypothetical protein [Dyadobacter sp. CY343]MCE7058465.1 hypothetical protein [Dyadobacter sp. CY343]
MRKLIFATILALLAICNLPSGKLRAANLPHIPIAQEKVAVRPEDLPEAVKSTLASDDYAEWKVSSAYIVKRDNNAQYYEINLKKGEESLTVNLDKYGRKVD